MLNGFPLVATVSGIVCSNGTSFDQDNGRCVPTSPSRDHYNPNLTISDALGIGFVIGSFFTTVIIALVLFVMMKKKVVADSKKGKAEELELENHVGRVVCVEGEYPL